MQVAAGLGNRPLENYAILRSFLPSSKENENERISPVTRRKSWIEQRVLAVNQHPEGRGGYEQLSWQVVKVQD